MLLLAPEGPRGPPKTTIHKKQENPLNVIKASRLSKVRGAAAYNALNTGDYDVLVHPNYVVTVQVYLIVKKYKVSVDGYGAKYKNFRTEKQKSVVTPHILSL